MDTALPQKFPFILDRNLAKANCTGNRVSTSCDTVVLGSPPFWVSKWRIGIKTLPTQKSPECWFSKVLIPLLHFDTQNGGEPNSPG